MYFRGIALLLPTPLFIGSRSGCFRLFILFSLFSFCLLFFCSSIKTGVFIEWLPTRTA